MLSLTRFQNLIEAGNDGRLDVVLVKMSALNEDDASLRTVVERNEGRALGLSGAYLPNGNLQVLAIADATTIILVNFAGDKNNGRANSSNPSLTAPGRDYLRDHVLGRTCGFVYAFDMGPLALALWQSHDLRIKQAIDVQSAGPRTTRAPRATIKFATADKATLYEGNITRAFSDFICENASDDAVAATITPLVQRAWAAHYISQLASMEEMLAKVPPIDTTKFHEPVIYSTLSQLYSRLIWAFSFFASWQRVLQTCSKRISSSQLRLQELTIHLLIMARSNLVLKLIDIRIRFVKA